MAWRFSHTNGWEEVSGSVITWDCNKYLDECLKETGYYQITQNLDANYLGLGEWVLYVRLEGDASLPEYLVWIGDGSSNKIAVWLQTFPDLIEWLRLYSHVGKQHAQA
jgi:hypothetical protein